MSRKFEFFLGRNFWKNNNITLCQKSPSFPLQQGSNSPTILEACKIIKCNVFSQCEIEFWGYFFYFMEFFGFSGKMVFSLCESALKNKIFALQFVTVPFHILKAFIYLRYWFQANISADMPTPQQCNNNHTVRTKISSIVEQILYIDVLNKDKLWHTLSFGDPATHHYLTSSQAVGNFWKQSNQSPRI